MLVAKRPSPAKAHFAKYLSQINTKITKNNRISWLSARTDLFRFLKKVIIIRKEICALKYITAIKQFGSHGFQPERTFF